MFQCKKDYSKLENARKLNLMNTFDAQLGYISLQKTG
jgi:hypothetical protein